MPGWYAATLLLSAAAAYALRGAGLAAVLADASAALWLVSVVGTILFLVPINSRIAGWTWDTRHTVRVALLFAAFVCLVLACLLPH